MRQFVVTGAELAQALGVSAQTVSNLCEEGLPHTGGGKGRPLSINLADALPWIWNRQAGAPAGSQRERLAKEQADKLAIANAKTLKQLVLVEHVTEVFTALAADIAGRLDGLPGRMANELAGINSPAEIRARLLDECRSIRAGFAGHIDELAQSAESPAGGGIDHAPTEEADARPVGRRNAGAPAGKRRAGPVAK